MPSPSVCRCQIKLLEFLRARFLSLSTGISVAFLVSLLATRVVAQDVSEPAARPRPESQPIGTPDSVPQTLGKARKSISKYDVGNIGRRGIGSGVNLYSLTREDEIGHELAVEVEMQSKVVNDPVIAEYAERLGQRLVRNSDAQVPFTIKVIDSDEMNVFALPGGYLYVNTGLILAVDNEAELAGLMAHEIAHVAAHHFARAETRRRLWSLLSGSLVYVGGPASTAIRGVVVVAASASVMKFSRDAEREADLLGLEYEYATGYDPQEFVQFFEKLHNKEKRPHNFLVKAFSGHPTTEDRIRLAQKEIATLLPDKDEYIVDTSEFEDVKSRILNLMNERRPSEDGYPVLHRHHLEDPTSSDQRGPMLHRPTD